MPKFQQIAQNIDLVSRLLARLDAIEATATDLQAQVTANTAAIAAIDISGINATLTSLQDQINTHETTLAHQQDEINTINDRLAAAGIP